MSRKPSLFSRFLMDMEKATGGHPAVTEAARLYNLIFVENGRFPPSALRQTPAIDYKQFMHVVPNAPSGTNQPDVCPALNRVPVNSTCTRDIGEETRNQKWDVPEFAKFNKNHLEKLMANGKKNQKERPFMGTPGCAMPMRCGYTITNPLNYQGTDVGYAGGGAGGGAGGQG